MSSNRIRTGLSALLISSMLAACTTFHVYQVGGLGDSQPQNVPDTEWIYVKRNSFLWGLVRQDLPVDNCRDTAGNRKGIEEIRIDRDAAQGLASILTLGLWNPVTIGWRCSKLQGQTGTLSRRGALRPTGTLGREAVLGETDDASEVRP